MLLALYEALTRSAWLVAWFWLVLLIGLVWLRRHLDLNRAGRDPVLTPEDAGPLDGPAPSITVLVAGKDEEANIETCLRGLLRQDYPALQVIAVNDRSSDRTAEIIDRVAAEDARLCAVHVRQLPDGWGGKNHAMHTGVQQARGEFLLFTDADCRFHAPGLVRAAVRFAEREQVDVLSVLPELDAHTFWERVVQPPAGAIMVFWFPPEKVNDPRSPRAYANGAFILMRRATYSALGGHERCRAVLNEDMHLARETKRQGLRLRVVRGSRMYSVRMYVGLRQIWNGWTRIFYGSFGTWPRLIVSTLFLAIFSLLPPATLLLSPLAGAAGVPLAAAALGTVVVQQSVLWRFYRLCEVRPWWAVTYYLGAALCLAMMLNAMRRLAGARTHWRGTAYQGGA